MFIKYSISLNGKCYIGQSVNIERRWMEHKLIFRNERTRVIKRALRKYGLDNFTFEIIEQCETNKLDEREIFWIAELKPEYNQALGGVGSKGHSVSDETKEIIRKKAKQQWQKLSEEEKLKIQNQQLIGPRIGHEVRASTREKLRMSNIGKKQSDETKEKRMKTMQEKKTSGWKKKGSPNSGRPKRKIYCIEMNMEFDSIKSASEYIGINKSTILRQLKRKHDAKVGSKPKYHFIYAE